MRIIIYPDTDFNDSFGLIGKLTRSDMQLHTLMVETLKNYDEEKHKRLCKDKNRIRKLSHIEAIHEYRIPPTRKKGVLRLYFCYHQGDIYILTGEIKKGNGKADKNKIQLAYKKYKEIKNEKTINNF